MAEIGSVRATRREISPATPGAPSSAFGAGVGAALTGISQTLQIAATTQQSQSEAQTNLDLAYKARQDKVTKANLQVDFLTLQNSVAQEVLEMGRNAPPGAPDFTNQAKARMDEAFDEFMLSVPEDMLPEFMPRVAESKISLLNNAFAFQVGSENSNYKYNVDKFMNGAINSLLSGTLTSAADIDATADQLGAQLDKLFETTPLPKEEARLLRDQYVVQLKSAQLARLAQFEAEGLGSMGGMAASGDLPAGMPGPAAALLKFIVGKESGGEFNVMYSPDPNNRRYFSDYSKHPNDPAVIAEGPHAGEMSSAAGGAQFIYSTWKDISERYGLEDFSPENQMRGAWILAQETYHRATGKRLETALASGNMMVIGQARRILARQWDALRHVTDEQFADAMANTSGTLSSLIDDPEFSMIPYDMRAGIIGDAQTKAKIIQTQIDAEAEKQKNLAYNDLLIGLRYGNKGVTDIQAFTSQHVASYEETVKLEEAFKQGNETLYNAQQFQGKIASQDFLVDSDEDRKQAAAFLQTTGGLEAVAAGDEAYVNHGLLPLVQQTAYIPENLVKQLTGKLNAQDSVSATFALDTMMKLRATSPQEFRRAFGDDMTQASILWEATKGSVAQENVLPYIRSQFDGTAIATMNARKELFKENVKAYPEDFTPIGIAEAMDFSGAPSEAVGRSLFEEYSATYNYMLAATGDHRTSKDAAIKLLGTRWGESNNGGYYQPMKYPPQFTAKPYNGSYNYIDPQLREHFDFSPMDRYELVSDGQTEKEFLAGKPASYQVVKLDENGLIEKVLTWRDTADFDSREDQSVANKIVRFAPSITSQMVQRQIDSVQSKNELKELQLKLWNYGGTLGRGDDGALTSAYPGGPEAYEADKARYKFLSTYGTDSKAMSPTYYTELMNAVGAISMPQGTSVPPKAELELMKKLQAFDPNSPAEAEAMLRSVQTILQPYAADPEARRRLAEIAELMKGLQ